MKEPASQPDTLLTPNKAEKNSLEKDLGSTQLRKTVFKKHYMEKSKNTGEPSTMKGSYDNRNPYTTGQKRPPDEERWSNQSIFIISNFLSHLYLQSE